MNIPCSKSFTRRALCALFVILSGCTPKCPQWEIEKISTPCHCFSAGKVFYPVQDTFSGIEVELDRGPSDTRMYLNIYSIPLLGSCEEESKILIAVTINEIKEVIEADLLHGNQRILVPLDIMNQIIEALLGNQYVSIAVGQYCAEIPPQNFQTAYQNLYR